MYFLIVHGYQKQTGMRNLLRMDQCASANLSRAIYLYTSTVVRCLMCVNYVRVFPGARGNEHCIAARKLVAVEVGVWVAVEVWVVVVVVVAVEVVMLKPCR